MEKPFDKMEIYMRLVDVISLQKLREKFPSLIFIETDKKVEVHFQDIQFWLELDYPQSVIIDGFCVGILDCFSRSSTLEEKKNDMEYQEFWQYILQHEFDRIMFILRVKIVNRELMNRIFDSFTKETLEIYYAMKTLYELKGLN